MDGPGHVGLGATINVLDLFLGLSQNLIDLFLRLSLGDHIAGFVLGFSPYAFEEGLGVLFSLNRKLLGFGHGFGVDSLGLFFDIEDLLDAFFVQAILSHGCNTGLSKGTHDRLSVKGW